MSDSQAIRDANLVYLNERGFKPATWMPLPCEVGKASEEDGFAGGTLRPAVEIAQRLLCHAAVFAWSAAPGPFGPKIAAFMDNNDLRALMTDDELEIVNMSKDDANAEFADSVGWRLENMWPLAWLLGAAVEPSATAGQLSDEVSGPLMGLFVPDFAITAAELVDAGSSPAIADVVKLKDRHYLAHNAVRAGQLGDRDKLPTGFDPIADGGAIHERRHSLTWALSPGTDWDDTDLST